MDISRIRHINLHWLLKELEARGITRAKDQALALGPMSASFLSQLKGGKKMGDDVARKLEAATGKGHGWMDRPQWDELTVGPIQPVSQSDATPVHIPRSAFRRVPVVGTASLGMDGYWTDLEYPVGHGDGYFEFPTTDKDAYVLQVRGGSMHPAIRSGWYVVIEPNKTPQMGEFVMVKLADGRSTVKEFLWHRDGEYVLNAIANNERLVVDEADIDVIHHVGGILPPSGRQG
ncbi:S24 family peptidase [Luteibacter aegosomatis]|uniref:S24 family peptidase n=1 Tax=Luteibacter aegosomatis TaxID=2911537 RepID=UPI001FFBA781|nr:S24 family peptidase [Luteibacter aegosomatis]UPG86825.1 S24 family peptidase [Luteibacter aegosomatis]